ncbi:MAG: hypothetical protein RR034_04105 [Bacteroidales bacterium]
MKTTSTKEHQTQENLEQKTTFRQLMGGEFLLNKKMIKWYPYFFLLFIMVGILVVNERSIISKKEKIKDLEIEYKKTISNLKKNNQFIPYEQNQLLIEMMNEQGFVKNDKQVYKILVVE